MNNVLNKFIVFGISIVLGCVPIFAKDNPQVDCIKTKSEKDSSDVYKFSFPNGEKLELSIDEKRIFLMINGSFIPNAEMQIIKDQAYVPLRIMSQELGMDVNWNATQKSVSICKGDSNIKMLIGQKKAYINDKEVTLDLGAIIHNNSVYIPLRSIEKTFPVSVEYQSNDQNNVMCRVIKNPYINIDEIASEETISKDKAIEIASKCISEGYQAVLENKNINDGSTYANELFKSIEDAIVGIKIIGKVSRYWVIEGPNDILVDEITGKVFGIICTDNADLIEELPADNQGFYLAGHLAG